MLVSMVAFTNLNQNKDTFKWHLTKNGKFTVRSMYLAMIQEGVVPHNSPLWNLKVPLKIKIFLWYLQKESHLQKII